MFLHRHYIKPNFGVGRATVLSFWLWLSQDWEEAFPARLVSASTNATQCSAYEETTFVVSYQIKLSNSKFHI